ncbi:transporter [Paenirhodobacter hankyongi]|nr:transporter [Sinirhodobacter hankyongi]
MERTRLHLVAAMTAVALSAGAAQAIDVAPGDYTLLPADTRVLLQYFQYSTTDSLHFDGVGKVPGSGIDAVTGVSRVLYYGDADGLRYGLQAYLPFGSFTEAKIGGGPVPEANGLGDLTVGATVWLAAPENPAQGTTFALTAFLTAPTGTYDPAGVSIGSGTWTLTPQVALIQGFGNGWFFDGIADVALSRDHDENGAKISHDPSWQLQAYLRYQPTPTRSISVGYSGKSGGETYVNGAYSGTRTRVDTLRLFANQFVSPTMQVQGMISKDFNAKGGADNLVTQIRLLKMF